MPRILISTLLLILTSTFALAANQFPADSRQQPVINLGQDTYRGVQISAELQHLNSTSGDDYLLTVIFSSVKNGKPLPEGDVAVKITSPDGEASAPLRLNPVDNVFQTEIKLNHDGESLVKIGSKLADGKKRIFRFFYTPAL